MPLVESTRELKTTLAALPRTPIARRGLESFDSSIDRRILRRLALGEEWDQTPSHHEADVFTVLKPDNGHLLSRRHVVRDIEAPGDLSELDRSLESCSLRR